MSDTIRRIAITGASGYIGSQLIKRLQDDDSIDRILAFDIRPMKFNLSSKVIFLKQDITCPMAEALNQSKIQAVAHLAFILSPGRNRATIQKVNLIGTANVLEACAQTNVKHLLYLSSTTVYGAHPDNPLLLTEEAKLRPVKGFQYGEDKTRSEALLNEFTLQHIKPSITILRAPPVMGVNANNFVSRAFSKRFLVGFNGYDPVMQFLHEDDLTEIMRICLAKRTCSGIYNVTGDGIIRWSEVAEIFGRKIINLPVPVLYSLTKITWNLRMQSDSPSCGLDFIRYRWTTIASKIKEKMGFQFRYSSREACEAFARRNENPRQIIKPHA